MSVKGTKLFFKLAKHQKEKGKKTSPYISVYLSKGEKIVSNNSKTLSISNITFLLKVGLKISIKFHIV